MSDEGMARPIEAWEEMGPAREDPPIKEWSTHSICFWDWQRIEPDRAPFQLAMSEREVEVCCYCGDVTLSGIYRRDHISNTVCQGVH